MKHKNNSESIDKKLIILAAFAFVMVLIEVIAIIMNLQNPSGLSVRIISPPGEVNGGAIKYEVTGASSVTEANKAIILEEYNNDHITESFRKITEKEAQDVAEQITRAGCGQITEQYVLAPPVKNAINWRNFGNDSNDTIETYMLDDEFLVQIDCARALDS